MTTRSPILSLRGIEKSYGPIKVVHGVDIDIHPGEVVALLGENGAGKSTLSNVISGAVQPSSGEMTWLGAAYAPANPRAAMDEGVGMIHQELKLLPKLSIAENIFVGRYPMKSGRIDRRAMEDRARSGLKRLGLDISPDRLVEGLSTGKQQLIEIAKALTLNARLLILDEPTAALGGEETQLLFQQIERLKSEGVGIIYISHRLEEIRQIADRIVVMRDGAKVREFDTGDVPVRTIVEAMVGRSLERMFPTIPSPSDEVTLEVRNLASPTNAFRNISFSVRKGEVFGIAGLMGAGRTELVRAITGADPISSGEVFLRGEAVTPRSPMDSIRNGIVLVPEDRKLQGVILDHSIAENIAYANLADIAPKGWISSGRLHQFADEYIRKFGVKGRGRQNAGELSGGNQQKVVLAKWLARKPQVVVLDEPTRGIDVGARSSIYDLIMDLARQGVSVIVVSSDLEEVLGVSSRIMVMSQGKQAGILKREDANDVSIMELATS
ncbi:sugar ABC transporter ATP-binding protein (plasmid) [Rhizobium sp. TH2]|uniref:sugar ABC transporter ATP-binding protein n=1 Tax=Rhizobium sp. TH2 TaxID=2775403 RepID=UPI002157BFBF|nr:sugar ABC transporter ATP-binding protein [Rhizobium sp. TH2]UVC12192.1 sugar ABC transporter ATP-binding protein [Rhizobium sp. TH2]